MERIRKVRGQKTGLQAGLPVEVLVPLQKRTALDYLLEPACRPSGGPAASTSGGQSTRL